MKERDPMQADADYDSPDVALRAEHLTRRFGDLVAVDKLAMRAG